ncbi:tetratricopeptide repeat protein [Rhodoflexus sp.]
MPSSYLNFRFRFLNAAGKRQSVIPLNGRADGESGLRLTEHPIPIEDIMHVYRHRDQLAVILKPYLALPKNLSIHVLPETSALLIEVADGFAFNVKSAIDQHLSRLHMAEAQAKWAAEGKGKLFRTITCPVCEASTDITAILSEYIYCRYCTTMFNQYQQVLPKSEQYDICPRCNYYGRLQTYPEVRFYWWGKHDNHSSFTENHICDTCAGRTYDETIWKNTLFLIGLPFTLYLKYMMSKEHDPVLAEMATANRLAQDGNMVEADVLYSAMLLRNDNHPGLLYNYGLAWLQNGEPKKAFNYLSRVLEICYNYEPAREMLEIYKDTMIVRS